MSTQQFECDNCGESHSYDELDHDYMGRPICPCGNVLDG